MVKELCAAHDVECATHEAFAKGGEGAIELAEKTVALADGASDLEPHYIYELDTPIEDKVREIATQLYGANGVYFEKKARKKIDQFTKLGYGNLPVCIAKTQASLSDHPRVLGAPKDWTLTVTDAALSAGAGFIVIICGEMMLMHSMPSQSAKP